VRFAQVNHKLDHPGQMGARKRIEKPVTHSVPTAPAIHSNILYIGLNRPISARIVSEKPVSAKYLIGRMGRQLQQNEITMPCAKTRLNAWISAR
jgi:hypothetical protein